MNKKTICYVAGKSGGHIIPCLTMIETHAKTIALTKISTMSSNDHVLFFSTNGSLDTKILSANTHVTWHVILPLASFIPSQLLSYPRIMWYFFRSFLISLIYLYKHKPREVCTTGGIIAIPVCIAAYLLRIPITFYVLDAIPGKALTYLAPLATTITICFSSTQQYFPKKNCILKPYPIKFSATDKIINQKEARIQLSLDQHKKTILFLGGSQGSLFLNKCAQKFVEHPSFSPITTQIIHQTGTIDSTDWSSFYKNKQVTAHVFTYSHDLALMYRATDYIICRAGAGTLFEGLFFEKKCIVIPLKTDTTDHQIANARAISTMYPQFFEYILQKNVENNYDLLIIKLLFLCHNTQQQNNSLESVTVPSH